MASFVLQIDVHAGDSKAGEQVQHSERNMPLKMAVHNFFVGRGADMPAVHRLAILSPSGEIEHILTQTDVLKFVHDRYGTDKIASKTLEESGVYCPHSCCRSMLLM